MNFPSSQAELIRSARGERSQADFARLLGVDRSCLSRYEREVLGAPPAVITYCLREIRGQVCGSAAPATPVEQALQHAREVVSALERIGPSISRSARTGRGRERSA